jgi:hypothetical protein
MEVYTSLDDVIARIKKAKQAKETLSMAYQVGPKSTTSASNSRFCY